MLGVEAVGNEVGSGVRMGKREIKMELRMVSVSVERGDPVDLWLVVRHYVHSRPHSHRSRLERIEYPSLGLTATPHCPRAPPHCHAVRLCFHRLPPPHRLPSPNRADHPRGSIARLNNSFPAQSSPSSWLLPQIYQRNLGWDCYYGCV